MNLRQQPAGRLVHGHVSVAAEPQDAKVDGSLAFKPTRNAGALALQVRRIASKSDKAPGFKSQRLNQLFPQVRGATGGISAGQPGPFVYLQDAEPGE